MSIRIRAAALAAPTAAILVAAATSANASVINFETIPGGTPHNKLQITNQFEATHGIRFSVSDGTPFELGMYNDQQGDGWIDNEGNRNVLHPDFYFGDYFARYANAQVPGRYLIIEYTSPSQAAGFDIIDIDNNRPNNPDFFLEEWTIRVFDLDADEPFHVRVISNLDPDTGDTWPTRFEFSFDAPRISRIEVEFTGISQMPGLAFDNFSPISVPAPGAAALLALGGLVAGRRRRA